jgi:transposase
MLEQVLLPQSAELELTEVAIEETVIRLQICSTSAAVMCPDCQQPSQRVHSHYWRAAGDIACAERRIRLRLGVRRFFCDNATCERKTFAERFPALLAPFARRTDRLAGQQRRVGMELGGEAGARLLTKMAMPTSADTVLRLVRGTSEETPPTPRVLGVDDWAWSKGQCYGTILVDLEQHRPVDLLPDRTAETLEQWLRAHPGVEIVTRDRALAYIDGIRRGAPDATQVADRWHLLRNLKEALERLLEQNRACLYAAAVEENPPPKPKPAPEVSPSPEKTDPPPLTQAEQQSQARRERRRAVYQAVVELHQQGVKQRAIARQLKMNRKTIRRYLTAGEFPERSQRDKQSRRLGRYEAYLRQRWAEGCRNGSQLYREIQEKGYTGSRSTLGRWVAQQRRQEPQNASPTEAAAPLQAPIPRPWSARRAAWLLAKDPGKLEGEEEAALERILAASHDVRRAYHFGQAFAQMIRQRIDRALEPWLTAVAKYKVVGLEGFAQSLEQDKAAVLAALTLPWSNGQVEGQVNRLKLIKRQMYGRAKFDLLRARVLHRGGP